MPRRLHAYVHTDAATTATVCAALERAIAPSEQQRCMNPQCERMISRPDQGRLPIFCSRACRRSFDYERSMLLADIQIMETALRNGGGTYVQKRRLGVALSTWQWALTRYPDPSAMTAREGGDASRPQERL